MKVRVKIAIGERAVDRTLEATDAEALLEQAKGQIAEELGWKGMFLRTLSTRQFAQLAVAKYNERYGSAHALPETAEDFIAFGLRSGNLEIIEE